MENIDTIRKLLNSNTLKQRREGVKSLDTLLDSPLVLSQLDANTAKLWPEDKLTYSSWPGVVNIYLSFIEREVLQHNRQLDAAATRLIKKIFSEAENTERCVPGRHHLLRIASFVFEKIKLILGSSQTPGEGLATPLGKELAAVMVKILLPQQQYCQRSNTAAFQGIIEEVMCRFEALQQKIDECTAAAEAHTAAAAASAAVGRLSSQAAAVKGRSAEVLAAEHEQHSMCSLLVALLSGVPGQLNPQFAADAVGFCVEGIRWFAKTRKFGKPEIQLLNCLTGLLLSYGPDLRPIVGQSCWRHLGEYVRLAWNERNPRVKESILCFSRACVCLGGPQYVGHKAMHDLQQLVMRDIQADNFEWDLQGNKQHQLLAALAASVFYHQIKTPQQQPQAAAVAAAAGQHSVAVNSSNGTAAADSGNGVRKSRSSSVGPHGTDAAAAAAVVDDHDGSSSDEDHLPRKRIKLLSPEQKLLDLVHRQPDRWGPVLALLLHLHGPLLPLTMHTAILNQLAGSSSSMISNFVSSSSATSAAAAAASSYTGAAGAAVGYGYRRSTTPGANGAAAVNAAAAAAKQQEQQVLQLQWLLRSLTETAVCWPAALHPAAAAAAVPTGKGSSNAAAAAADARDTWQQIWDSMIKLVAAAVQQRQQQQQQLLRRVFPSLTDALCWLLHVMLARHLVKLNSRTAALTQLLPLLLQQQPQQQHHAGDTLGLLSEQQQQQQQQAVHLPLSDCQLALLISLLAGEQMNSQAEMQVRQQLLLACLTTANALCSSSSSRMSASTIRISSTGSADHALPVPAMHGGGSSSTAAAAASCFPDLLLPAMLVLLESPGLPTPGLNGHCGVYEIIPSLNPENASSGAWGLPGSLSHIPGLQNLPGRSGSGFSTSGLNPPSVTFRPGTGCNIVWYSTSSWWGIDQRVEVLFEGLDDGLECLERKTAAVKLHQVLAAAAAESAAAAAAAAGGSAAAECLTMGSSGGGEDAAAAAAVSRWKCWCALADWMAETLSQIFTSILPDEDEDQDQDQQGPSSHHDPLLPSGSSSSIHYSDPAKQICHLLLLANAAANLPCLAAIKCIQQQQQHTQQQQQQQQCDVWCGVGFSGLPGLHVQLQQLMMAALEHCGALLRDHLPELPCQPGSTWIIQLMHLGATLARLQRLTDTIKLQPAAAAAAGQQQQQQAASSQRLAYAVAAGVMQPVVLQLQRVVSDAAAAAVAAASDPQARRVRAAAAAASDIDLDDDFTPIPTPVHRGSSPTLSSAAATPMPQGFGTLATGIQQTPGFSTQGTMGPPAAKPHAAAAAAGSSAGPPGYTILMPGGLAGFSGRSSGALGLSVITPTLLGFSGSSSNPDIDICGSSPCGFRQGFGCGGVGEGLAGLCGSLGVGLRVLAALSPACGPDAAQGLLQLWRHVSGVAGGAPSEGLLEGLVETMCAAVCAGGWLQLGQLLGMIQGRHALLSPKHVPLPALHLLLRIIQAVAVAAPAAGVDLAAARDAFAAAAAASQGGSGQQQQQQDMDVDGVPQDSLLGGIVEIFDSVIAKLEKHRTSGDITVGHNPLPQATQLQLGMTLLALLPLLPQHAYGTAAAAAAAAAAIPAAAADAYAVSGSLEGAADQAVDVEGISKIEEYKIELLDLLDSGSYALRVRAGPLVCQLLADAAAAAAAAPGGSSSSRSVTVAVKTVINSIQRHSQLQTVNRLTEDQQCNLDLIRSASDQVDDLSPRLNAIRDAKNALLRWETAVVQVADLAAAAPLAAAAALQLQEPPNTLDTHLLLLLLGHTAVMQQLPAELLPSLTPCIAPDSRNALLLLSAAAADLMAAQQQYQDRAGYLHYHAAAVLWQWFASGRHNMEQLLLLAPLLCPAAAAAAETANEAVIDYYGAHICISLIHNTDSDQQLAAAAAGVDLPALLNRYKIQVFGTLLPLTKYSDLGLRVKELAGKAGKTPRTNLSSRLVLLDRFFSMSLPSIVSQAVPAGQPQQQQQQQWVAAAQRRDVSMLYYPQPVAKQACMAFAEALSREEVSKGELSCDDSWFTKSHIRPRGMQMMITNMHRNIVAAAQPVHKLQQLGQIEGLLHLLQPDEITTPAVARYIISILLQHVQIPLLQSACCDLMEIIFQQLYQAAAGGVSAAAAEKSSNKAAAAAAKAAMHSRQQLAAAVLAELLPQTVATLVQCVEEAAAGRQQQQQGWWWSNPSRAAAAAADRSVAALQSSDLPREFPAVRLLLYLMSNPPAGLLPVISTLDLLPQLPVLAAAAAVQQQQQRGLTLPQGIVMLADRVTVMTVSSRQRSIQTVTGQIRQHVDQLYVRASSSSSGAQQQQQQQFEGRQQVDPTVTAAAFRLAQLGAQLHDKSVTALSAELLAIAGPLDPDIITFDAAAAASSNGSSSSTDFPMVSVLQHLVDCLFDCQPDVVEVAQSTLTHLLATPEGKAALQSLLPGPKGTAAAAAAAAAAGSSALLHSYLYLFTTEANTAQDKKQQQQQQQQLEEGIQDTAVAAAAALAEAAAASLWSPLGKPYDSWLCGLCNTLLRACGAVEGSMSRLLCLLAEAAKLRTQLAALLLPHALLLLCGSDGRGSDIAGTGSTGLAARLGAAITQGLNLGLQIRSRRPGSSSNSSSSSTAAVCDTRCLNMLLSCLEHNRCIHRQAMLALANPQQEPLPPAAWYRCYCLHLDYLEVAAAAMQCKAYFNALIYIEHWCEEQYGKVTYNNPNNNVSDQSGSYGLNQLWQLQQDADTAAAAGQQRQRQVLENLLLDLYSNVNEPDGVYAVAAAFGSNACQLHLLRQEQQWAKVLGAEDALMQAAAVQQQQQQQQGLATNNAGVVTALRLLGCQAAAQQCLSAVANTAGWAPGSSSSSSSQQQQQQQVTEMQCELAWRLSDWGITDVLYNSVSNNYLGIYRSTSSGLPASKISAGVANLSSSDGSSSSSSFNASVLAALHALQSHSCENFMTIVSNAQHAAVMQLVSCSTHSAAAINPVLVQLQMMQMLQKGMLLSSTSNAATPAAAAAAEQFLRIVLGPDYVTNGRSAAANLLAASRFQLSDQILSLQAALCKVLRRPDSLALTLQAQAATARQSGQINFATAALNQLQQLLHHAAAAAGSSLLGPDRQRPPGWVTRLVSPDADWVLESVRLKWMQGQQLLAFRELQSLVCALQQQQQQLADISSSSSSSSASLATALMLAKAQAGEWMAAGQFSNSTSDAMTLFHDAAAIAQQQQQQSTAAGSSDPHAAELHCNVFFQLASYADQRFRETESQLASPEWQKQLKVLESKRQLLQQLEQLEPGLRKQYAATQSHKTASASHLAAQYKETVGRLNHTRRTVAADADVVEQRNLQRGNCLKLALSNYRACITAGSRHDLQVVYRLCSLWFKHWQDPAVNAELAAVFDSVPAAKFVPLVYQMASRLDTASTNFQAVLHTALSGLSRHHPYHTLYSLIALKNGSRGKQTAAGSVMEHQADLNKVQAAAALLDCLRAAEPDRMKPIIDDMDGQVQVFIDIHSIMATVPRDNRGGVTVTSYPMPAAFRRKLQDFKHAPPICLSLELDPTGRYEDVPYVVTVDSTIDFCGGINSPMVIKTVDSTGKRQRQLAKSGNDDLRQDAVMQQFFGLVTALLRSSPASRQRRLGIRTYRHDRQMYLLSAGPVVPCSPTTGVLEWVEGTKPMTDYLAEGRQREGGAIAIYRKPGNLTWYDCYMQLQQAWQKRENIKDKFLEVCAHFPPVFHHFFLERFPHPAAWFESRVLYTRATAVNSMAGYVVGLGDRHMGNILLDMNTAEVVHIDLGIAFDQGMFLNTPERVPFRLTANVVDGMGAAGVEGPFRRCCETTLEVLRSHKEALLTVVEVVLHDPMYKWQMTTVKAQRKQQDPLGASAAAGGSTGSASAAAAAAGSSGVDEIGNADAERAVLRVKQKLEGQDVEGGVALSVAAQVGVLMQAAQDPDNLCRMFIGWAAFM